MKKTYLLLIFLLALHLFFLINLRFTAWPEMLSYAYLRNHGFLIYKDMIHPYPPLLTMGLSFRYALFGYELWVLKATSWGIALISGLTIWFITRTITKNNKYAFVALCLYIFLQPFLEGNMLWFDTAVILPILLGLLFILRKNIFLTGLFLAAAALIKQTAGLYLVFIILYLVFIRKIRFNQVRPIFFGPLILGVPLAARLIQEGALGDFINWVLVYPMMKWGGIIGYVQMELSARDWLVIILLFIPLLFIVSYNHILKDATFQILLFFLAVALVSVYPRFSFFHFQTAIAILVILYGYLLSKIKTTRLTIAYCLLPTVFIFVLVHKPVLARDWQKEARFYGKDDIKMAQIIANRVGENERVYLLGLHSGLYAMAGRLPPARWADNFPWYLEIPEVQEEIIVRWEKDPPKYVIWKKPKSGNWFDLGTYQPQKIVQYINSNYNEIGNITEGVSVWRKND